MEDRDKISEEIAQLKKDLGEHMRLAEERLDRLKYLQAEFDNYRKWSEKDKAAIIALANENLIKDLLVILDDFDQALPSLEQEKNKEGMMMVRKKMLKILKEYGLQPIECEGKKFDPHFHEVLMQVENKDMPEHAIVEELQKGYLLNDRIIRTAKVKVSKKSAGEPEKGH